MTDSEVAGGADRGDADHVAFDASAHPHRRRNPLTGDWVVVSPHRTKRPWQGQTGEGAADDTPAFDPDCYLCPGNPRAGGVRNPDYDATFVFENDFAALLPEAPAPVAADDGLFGIDAADGECRVVCFSPRHDLTLSRMSIDEILVVIELWRSQLAELLGPYRWVQLFETRGAISGASNPHPHGQVWASRFLPDEAVRELDAQRKYHGANGSHLLLDYAERELRLDERVVTANDHWVVVVPFWAYWPYETLVLPRRPVSSLLELDEADREGLADALKVMLQAFDRLFNTPFPYCSGWHNAPLEQGEAWQLHAHYYPPLLRSADVAKIPASYELLANLQRDLTPETAAEHLRAVR